MIDLTKGSIVGHLLKMAAPVAISMLAQIMYQLIDLYFVTKIGVAATAGVNAAGNAALIVLALSQVLGVGTVVLVAHAVGGKDQADANLIFNQSIALSVVCGVMIMVLLHTLMRPYLRSVAADEETIDAGATFIFWMLPGYALTLPMTVLSSALRGTGIVRPVVALQIITVIINAVLAPVLIAGWGTGMALGVSGAGLATSISIVIGLVILARYFHRLQRYITIQRQLMVPKVQQWGRILTIGLPAGGDIALFFVYTALVYYTIRNFGAYAQAGFGIGSRVMQVILLPGICIGFAVGPIAGQNFGAKDIGRVRETFRKAALIGAAVMMAITILAQWRPMALVRMFDADDSAIAVAAVFIQITSWAIVAHSLVNTCSGMFQGLGNTVPSLVSSCARLLAFAIPVMWLSTQPAFHIEQVWYLSVASVSLQAMVSLWLLRAELKKSSMRIVASDRIERVRSSVF